MSNGELWVAIRGKLPALMEDFRRLADMPSHEMESVMLDGIARKLANAVTQAEARNSAVMDGTRSGGAR